MVISKLAPKKKRNSGDDFVYDPNKEAGGPASSSSADDDDEEEADDFPQEEDQVSDADDDDEDDTDDFGTTTHPSGDPSKDDRDTFAETLASRLTRGVKVWRSIVSIMLLVTAVLVTVSTYLFMTSEEAEDFDQAFSQFGFTLSDNAKFASESVANSLESRSDSITSFVRGTNDQEWPLVSINDFEVKGQHTRRNTQTELFAFCPILNTPQEKAEWSSYSEDQSHYWLQDSYKTAVKTYGMEGDGFSYVGYEDKNIPESVYRIEGEWTFTPENSPGPWMPLWQLSPPPPNPYPINFNTLSSPDVAVIVDYLKQSNIKGPIMTERLARHSMFRALIDQYQGITEHHYRNQDDGRHLQQADDSNSTAPHNPDYENTEGYSFVLYPVYDNFDNDTRNLTGVLISLIRWDWILSNIMRPDTETIHVVMENTCGESNYTYQVQGAEASFVGIGDVHDESFDKHVVSQTLSKFSGVTLDGGEACEFVLKAYPTLALRESYDSDQAVIFTAILGVAFGFTALFFLFYVRVVQRRQAKVMATAARTNAIVSSLFPSNVRDRIMRDAEEAVNNHKSGAEMSPFLPGMGDAPKKKLKSFLDGTETPDSQTQLVMFKTKPIADLFPETTVMFGDLVGFTAWSSVREPTQVFQLLETIYHAFDEIARRRRVFKVETVGDCYVAVVGLPDPRKDHAIIMARFARDCLQAVNDLTKKLEVTLGPDTGDLQIRVGLHSGPVTAGVLRGEKSRFQLFGDTVNTAARMESTGAPSRIQLSKETADLLMAAGKSNWVKEREEKVRAKGKGELQTYWLEIRHEGAQSVSSGSNGSEMLETESERNLKMPQPAARIIDDGPTARPLDAKAKRLVDWNCDQMVRLMKLVVARRNALQRRTSGDHLSSSTNENFMNHNLRKVGTVLEEVREIITLPKFDPTVYRNHDDPDSVKLSDEVLTQLHDYVSTIATLYRDNPFHNFEHASHVTMSVSKLLSRIVSPQDVNRDGNEGTGQNVEEYAREVHKSTYGITSDPLTQFAVVFSALIHDVDHTGVPNATLVKENAKIAELYKQKSVAEQNSVDLAWDLLMDSRYAALQGVLYTNSDELDRFRQLVVNTVMATDIVDKDLKALRNARWDKAFKEYVEEDEEKDVNRKATIVIEHLIQASDVAHTMQHWHIFRKWNERLFLELHKAYYEGRSETNPAEFWYNGEIGFFDFYIIPLAKKLKECGVFGVSSEEYLNYAMKNREEWIVKGKEIVEQMLEKVPAKPEPEPEAAPEEAEEKVEKAPESPQRRILPRAKSSGMKRRGSIK